MHYTIYSLPGKQAALYVEQDHFDAENIKMRQSTLEEKFDKLEELMKVRKEKLSEALMLQQFYRDIEDEVYLYLISNHHC